MNTTIILLLLSIAAYVAVMVGMGILGKKTFQSPADCMYFQVARNILSFLMMAIIGRSFLASGLTFLLAGAMSVAVLISSYFSLTSYKYGPVSISVLIVSSLSMVISALTGPIFWGESISIGQIIGIFLCLASMALLTEKSLVKKASFRWIVCLLLAGLGGGLQGPTQKVLTTSPYAGETMAFVTYTFAFCTVTSLIMFFIVRGKDIENSVTFKIKGKVLWLFISQAALSVFLNINNLKLVAELPTVIFFPAYSIGGLLLTSVATSLMFQEKMSTRQIIGFVTGLVALVLISGIFI